MFETGFPVRASLSLTLAAVIMIGCADSPPPVKPPVIPHPEVVIGAGKVVPDMPGETHLRNVRQITFGGENGEAYWSNDGSKLIWQTHGGQSGHPCDQIYIMDLRTGERHMVSTGNGRTTCAYFMQGDKRILFASTHLADIKCPPSVWRPGREYVWGIYKGYDIFTANPDGSDLRRITNTPGYDAEATVCPVSGLIVFTSVRDGDIELYSMEPDGTDVRRLTNRPGYDGGAFFSHDGTKLVQRSGYLKDDKEKQEFYALLAKGLVKPSHMEITVLDRDGKNFRKVTNNGKANFAPYWLPDDKRIIFASNMESKDGRDFDLYLIREDGTGQEKVTHNPSFDSFPMFSPDGKYLAFASNRHNPPGHERDTNIFVAEWVDAPKR
ncbi:MAG: PD40 domain-containing protein [Planctomycetes bacterium]|nr:PD40 domain-containing protein [Planctomycetota bacterium]MCB9872172.1 PD40 domain-containing protein [Planctomycetota bacterium]